MAKPTEWMTWEVPETQMEPLGFNTRWTRGTEVSR